MTALSPPRDVATTPAHVLDALPFAVVSVTRELLVTSANREAERMLGLESATAGAPLPDPWGGLSLRRLARSAIAPGAPPMQLRGPAGGGRLVELTASPTSEGAVLTARDVTADGIADAEAERAFAVNAAHELRGSLAGISAAVEALELGAKDEPGTRDELLGGIGRELRLLGDEIEALLGLERARAGRPVGRLAAVPLAPLVEEIAGALAVGPAVRVRTACEPGVAARGTRPLLAVALRNVARNAAEHTHRGTIAFSSYRRGDEAVLEVADAGRGVPPDLLERVFERFAGATPNGAGIGLALTRQITHALGGEVVLESGTPGTTVRLVLPAV